MPMASVGQEFRKGAKGMVCLHSMMSGSQSQDSRSEGQDVCRLIHVSVWWLMLAVGWDLGWAVGRNTIFCLSTWLAWLTHSMVAGFPGQVEKKRQRQRQKTRQNPHACYDLASEDTQHHFCHPCQSSNNYTPVQWE